MGMGRGNMGGARVRRRHAHCKLKALEFERQPIALSRGALEADPGLGGGKWGLRSQPSVSSLSHPYVIPLGAWAPSSPAFTWLGPIPEPIAKASEHRGFQT